MPDYLFRFPASTPLLTHAGLADTVRIGRTVDVKHWPAHGPCARVILLYGKAIASIFEDRVEFPVTGDRHRATREWIARIARDNQIGTAVWRDRRGVLLVDGIKNRQVEGGTFAVTRKETTA